MSIVCPRVGAAAVLRPVNHCVQRRLATACLLACALVACGAPGSSDEAHLLGRTDAVRSESEATGQEPGANTAIYFYDRTTGAWCSGQMLNHEFVLTAAHCVMDEAVLPDDELSVYYTNTDGEKVAVFRGAVRDVHIHPAFVRTVRHDFALIQLQQAASTCEASVWCAGGEPNRPMNAMINWNPAVQPQSYELFGYGTNAAGGAGGFVLRHDDTMPRDGLVNGGPEGSSASTRWGTREQDTVNPCGGDSGAAWLQNVHGYWMSFGVHSQGTSCASESFGVSYAALYDQEVVRWLAGRVAFDGQLGGTCKVIELEGLAPHVFLLCDNGHWHRGQWNVSAGEACDQAASEACRAQGAFCEKAVSAQGEQGQLCRWKSSEAACDATQGRWVMPDDPDAIEWPGLVEQGAPGACVSQPGESR